MPLRASIETVVCVRATACKHSWATYVYTRVCRNSGVYTRYCFACKLMNNSNVFGKQGYKDWKHTSNKVPCHEKSALHLEALIQVLQLSDAGCRVDTELVKQSNAEPDYWHAVLERIVETIRYLSEHGLPFRGSNEIIGSPRNGNYLVQWSCWPYSIHFLHSTSNVTPTRDGVTLPICRKQFATNFSIC